MVIGQAPGRAAQESRIPWNDPSGVKLREWMGVTDEQFYDPDLISLLPMDFYYPGKARTAITRLVGISRRSGIHSCSSSCRMFS